MLEKCDNVNCGTATIIGWQCARGYQLFVSLYSLQTSGMLKNIAEGSSAEDLKHQHYVESILPLGERGYRLVLIFIRYYESS